MDRIMSPTAELCVALGLLLGAASTAQSQGSGENPGEDQEFSFYGLELWSVVVSACALGLSLMTVVISCVCCYCCSGRCLRRRQPARRIAEPAIWVQSTVEAETDTHLNGSESATNNFGSNSHFHTLPEITVGPAPSGADCEEEEDLYDDGSTVRGARPESNIYAEAELSKSDCEPLYNNIPGDNVSQGSYYMQLVGGTANQFEKYDSLGLNARRKPKDHTENWEPPHL
ncbi:hypothetical protein GBAR_LOCUS6713 [Geodia barretti]|uniref:Uncharacterized protein n=1 Tax=Geodia barretti TaxID=519541 RepID=A0AA35RHD8_GEOBA|nr:hypothetical protein GBAR_LOCUS6713 [Geodia barretti]